MSLCSMAQEFKIKEEPLDIDEYIAETQQGNLKVEDIKVECDEIEFEAVNVADDAIKIVEEKSGIITVDAVDLKSEDERKFIERLTGENFLNVNGNKSDTTNTCANCKKTFRLHIFYKDHVESGLCGSFDYIHCTICPLTFKTRKDLDKHLEFHKSNRYFCGKFCGRHFDTLEQCEEHEFSEHAVRKIKCNICNQKFDSFTSLSKHMPQHRKLQRHVCSYCNEWFTSSWELYEHWQTQSCGRPNTNSALSVVGESAQMVTPKVKQLITDSVTTQNFVCEPQEFITEEEIQIKQEPETDDDGNENINYGDSQHATDHRATNDPSPFCIQIKTEPEDEIVVKDEPLSELGDSMDYQLKQEPFDDDETDSNAHILPIIPDSRPSSVNVTPTFTLQTLPHVSAFNLANVKTEPGTTTSLPRISLLQSVKSKTTNSKIVPVQLHGVKIVKLSPNAKIVKLPSCSKSIQVKPAAAGSGNKQVLIQFKGMPMVKLPTGLSLNSIGQNGASSDNAGTTKKALGKVNSVSKATINRNSETLEHSFENALKYMLPASKFNSDDFKQLLATITEKAEQEKRNVCVPRELLEVIDSLPEQREIIQKMLNEIKAAQLAGAKMMIKRRSVDEPHESNTSSQENESVAPANSPVDNMDSYLNKKSRSNSNINISESSQDSFTTQHSQVGSDASTMEVLEEEEAITSFFLPVETTHDPKLVRLRRLYPNYRFSWLCPSCPMLYEQKHAFRAHLVSVHNMYKQEIQNLKVEVRRYSIPSVASGNSSDGAIVEIPNSVHGNKRGPKKPFKRRESKKYTCTDCGRECSSRVMLHDHIRGKCSREPQYQCRECGKKFFSSSTLNCHMTIHTGELPHKCSYCDKRFRTRGQVTVHHRTHTGERPFVCQICSQAFTHRETLISHLSRHIGMKRYKCYACNKHFSCISGLKTHRDIRPDTCGKVKFNSRAIGPRVRVVRGRVIFEPQPEINPYLRSDDPQEILSEIQNQPEKEA